MRERERERGREREREREKEREREAERVREKRREADRGSGVEEFHFLGIQFLIRIQTPNLTLLYFSFCNCISDTKNLLSHYALFYQL